MERENRAPILFALLLLLFFVSTSAGFASVSSIQEQLRAIQLKLIAEKVKLLQQDIIKVGQEQVAEREAAREEQILPFALTADEPKGEELARLLEQQVQVLEGVIAALRPRAIDEEARRIEQRIGEIKAELKDASGVKLLDLQTELNELLSAYEALQAEVRRSLTDSITYRQALVIGEQIRQIQAKAQVLPREIPKPVVVPVSAPLPEVDPAVKAVEEQVEKLRLKVVQVQVKVIQEKINQLTGR